MRPTWLPLGLALILPAVGLLGACGPGVDTEPTGGGGGTSNTGGSTTTPNPTGGAGGVGNAGGSGGTGGVGGVGGVGGDGGGGNGQGGGPPPANDLCPGEAHALAIGETLALAGTLKGANDDYQTFCADTSSEPTAPDVVYKLTLEAAATVNFEIKGDGFIPAMSLRVNECNNRPNGTTCFNLGTSDIDRKVGLEPNTYYLVIDSADGKAGDFSLNIAVTTPTCGDGAINAGEQCDPGNNNEDGCFNPGTAKQCQYGEPPPDPAIVQCPGGLVTIGKGDSFALGLYDNGSGGTTNFNEKDDPLGDFTGPCPYFAYGPENIFQILPTGSGQLTITIGHDADLTTPYCDDPEHACGDFIIYLREGTCTNQAQVACADTDPDFLEVLTIQHTVTANTPYWVIVDSYADAILNPSFVFPGPYFLEVKLE